MSYLTIIRNYLTIVFRNLTKHNLYSVINILSLSIGIAACIAIYLFVHDEQSFDWFDAKMDDLYRLEEVLSKTKQGLTYQT